VPHQRTRIQQLQPGITIALHPASVVNPPPHREHRGLISRLLVPRHATFARVLLWLV
jgi:hypothetical protein